MNLTEARMQKARGRLEQMKAAGETITQEHNLVKKANANPGSKAKAIAAMCYQCFGGTEEELPDAGWKEEIRGCTSPACALYQHRPYR
ncbi:hypothetical protein SAMN02745124_01201 [Desulfofustis glycolicus DSM 9705]|uniref:Uncharacterized protein n=2 Tax=Desulfofustis glycolicus TaxID=51195 RepID=A0A1M5UJX1_9BACT|nr:hypothetical protein SAMN02745124_01201 [Desulfofustis glycolicus DSM 9705]